MQEIKKKIEGKEISLGEAPGEKPRDNVISIMDALKASIREKSNDRGGRSSKAGKAPKKAGALKGQRRPARA
jgi:non-homologous end joining protein Ku